MIRRFEIEWQKLQTMCLHWGIGQWIHWSVVSFIIWFRFWKETNWSICHFHPRIEMDWMIIITDSMDNGQNQMEKPTSKFRLISFHSWIDPINKNVYYNINVLIYTHMFYMCVKPKLAYNFLFSMHPLQIGNKNTRQQCHKMCIERIEQHFYRKSTKTANIIIIIHEFLFTPQKSEFSKKQRKTRKKTLWRLRNAALLIIMPLGPTMQLNLKNERKKTFSFDQMRQNIIKLFTRNFLKIKFSLQFKAFIHTHTHTCCCRYCHCC